MEDEIPTSSPVNSVHEQPAVSSLSTPSPQTTATPAAKEEPSDYPDSVNRLQGRFEDLGIDSPPYSCLPSESKLSGSCPYSQVNHETPGMFQPHESRKMISCTSGNSAVARHILTTHNRLCAERALLVSAQRQNAIRNNTGVPPPPDFNMFSVYCNNCNEPIPDEHYHCSTCDDGDFDLCQKCVDGGCLCEGDDHWMIKRSLKNGKPINSTTETIAPKRNASESKITLVQPEESELKYATRTCNSCIQGMLRSRAVVCQR